MRLIKLAAAAVNQTPLDWGGNRRNILVAIRAAREADVGLLCLPEMCITGYGCEDAFHSPHVSATAWRELRALLPHTRGLAVSLGLPILHQGAYYNCAALVIDGRLEGIAAKRHMAGDGVHYEPRWFKPWPTGGRALLDRDGEQIPLGDYLYDLDGVRVGFEICEEAWVARRPGGDMAARGVDVVLNPSASHFAFGKHRVRERFVVEGSRAFGVAYVYSNLVGNDAGRVIYDGGCIIASNGALRAAGPRLFFTETALTTAVVDVDTSRMQRARTHSFEVEPVDRPGEVVAAAFTWPVAAPQGRDIQRADWERGADEQEETFTRAVALALHDYLRKSRARGWLVSLSGGADSAAVTALCTLAVQMAADELGLDGLKDRLSHVSAAQDAPDVSTLTRALLTTVYQATVNSSDVTRSAAAAVAAACHATHHVWNVDDVVADYVGLAERALGRSLSWETDDIALQNIQARARAPGAWMLANIENKLLLATSNRSEAAVGYATMDGDTCGGISPIAGIDKAFLRRWLRWMEATGPAGVGPMPALSAINSQQPTAELRPSEANQTDEDDLMPYPVLDAIERLAIRDKHGPADVLTLIQARFPEVERDQLVAWVRRFFTLWCRNQWKRERYAPSFHLDDENLDPKSWCRFPILSGGFARELAALDEHSG